MEEKWNKSKTVHSIMKHVASKVKIDVEKLYESIAWPLYRRFGHAYDAFQLAVAYVPHNCSDSIFSTDAETVFEGIVMSDDVRNELLSNIERRLARPAVRIHAHIDITCFEYEGIDAIREALLAGEALSNDEFKISIRLIAPPTFVIATVAMDHEKGIEHINLVCDTIGEVISRYNGNLVVKKAAHAVMDNLDNMLPSLLEQLEREHQGGEEDEDE